MKEQKAQKLYYATLWIITLLTLVAGWTFYSGIPRNSWLHLFSFMLLTTFLQTISVRLTTKISYTLSTATIFPVIYLYGTTPAMLVSAVAGLSDGILNKKDWQKTLFNVSQLSLSALVGSVLFQLLGGPEVSFFYQGFLAMGFSTLVHVSANFLLVGWFTAVAAGTSMREQIDKIGFGAFISSLGTAFVGAVFTLFVKAYGLAGLLFFGILLIHLSELLKAAAEVSRERVMRMELQEELLIDEMTKAYNFRFLNNWLNQETDEQVAVLFLDIDDFKTFNDCYGHSSGDQVLITLISLIKQTIREQDQVIRYGGDEFVVLLPGLNRADALDVAQRIVDALAKSPPISGKHPITVSIGIAVAPDDASDKRQLLMAADQAMYCAKKAGKNTIFVWNKESA